MLQRLVPMSVGVRLAGWIAWDLRRGVDLLLAQPGIDREKIILLGAVAGELTARRNLQAAAGAGVGAFLGLLLATAGKLALGFAMLGLFLLIRFL